MSKATYRIIFSRDGRTSTSVDCTLVAANAEERVYHTVDDESDVRALRVHEASIRDDAAVDLEILTDSGNEEGYVHVEREKEAPYELYVVGGMVSTTKTRIGVEGEYHTKVTLPKYESATKLRINDCLVHGEGEFNNQWEWTILDVGSAVFAKKDSRLADEMDVNECIAVGYDEPIERVQTVRDVV